MFHWHKDSFEIPRGAVHLAAVRLLPSQAFRWGSHAYGIQFHPEVDRQIVWEWTGESDADAAFQRTSFEEREQEYRICGHTLLENFSSDLGMPVRG